MTYSYKHPLTIEDARIIVANWSDDSIGEVVNNASRYPTHIVAAVKERLLKAHDDDHERRDAERRAIEWRQTVDEYGPPIGAVSTDHGDDISSAVSQNQTGASSLPCSDDICANYHGGNRQSVAANERIEPMKQTIRLRILNLFGDVYRRDYTCEQIEKLLDLKHQSASARIAELKREGVLEETGRTLNGYAVLRRVK